MINHPPPSPSAPSSGPSVPEGGVRPQPGPLVVVTGMSGAGKTLSLKALEDLGYEAVDNLPLFLLNTLVRSEENQQALVVGIDIRTRGFGVAPMLEAMDHVRQDGHPAMRLLFVDCDDEVLCRRYTETRRRHPLALDRPLIDGISLERALILPLRGRADVVIDTTSLPPATLKRVLGGHFSLERTSSPVIFIISFSYRRGLPREADLVFDTRFLENPHYVPDLRPLSGRDAAVAAYVEADPGFPPFFLSLTALLEPLLPRFVAEGKSYLTIAVGCTGGRHRSVTTAEKLAAWMREGGQTVDLRHRDLEEGEVV